MKKVLGAIITGALFAGLMFLLGSYDVAEIGQAGTEVGFSHVNQFVHDFTGVNMLWYDITDYIGYGAIGVCGLFAIAGFVQMIKRRRLFRVDREIWALGFLFAAVIGCYVFFEKYVVNYRPIIMPGAAAPEASFPSSHTMLIITVMASTAMVLGRYVSSGFLRTLVTVLCAAVMIITVYGRMICGVHWFTDIIGGILLSITLLMFFSAVLQAAWKKDSLRYDRPAADTIVFEAPGRTAHTKERGAGSENTDRGYTPKH
jgi:undecaprenyl-diphosphatase